MDETSSDICRWEEWDLVSIAELHTSIGSDTSINSVCGSGASINSVCGSDFIPEDSDTVSELGSYSTEEIILSQTGDTHPIQSETSCQYTAKKERDSHSRLRKKNTEGRSSDKSAHTQRFKAALESRNQAFVNLWPSAKTPASLEMISQLETPPVGQEVFAAESTSIYASITSLESIFIQLYGQSNLMRVPAHIFNLTEVVKMHITLVDDHFDFCTVTQHPEAAPAIQRLLTKYKMPAQLWKCGIVPLITFLEANRPQTSDHLDRFLQYTYSIITMLYEMFPKELSWIQYLGALSKFRMSLQNDSRDYEIWKGVFCHWITLGSKKSPANGLWYHELALLTDSDVLQKLCYVLKALGSADPLSHSGKLVRVTFEALLKTSRRAASHVPRVELSLLKAHGALLLKRDMDITLEATIERCLRLLPKYLNRTGANWKARGLYIALINIEGLLDYGSLDNNIRTQFAAIFPRQCPSDPENDPSNTVSSLEGLSDQPNPTSTYAIQIAFSTLRLCLQRLDTQEVVPHIHLMLVFILGLAQVQVPDTAEVLAHVPWKELVHFLNSFSPLGKYEARHTKWSQINRLPLQDDHLISGQVWSPYPDTWWISASDAMMNDPELPSDDIHRKERILWLCIHISLYVDWLRYNRDSKTFSWELHD